jgi:hypothetical protein
VITSQPQDATVNSGQTANFSVTASGSKPLRYQWYRNGSLIAAATNSSYSLSATINDFGARFSVMVFNSLGTTNSREASLTVNLPPVIVTAFTNVWKYNQNGLDLGTAWRAPAYDDSAWPSGPGGLMVEDNTAITPYRNTTLSLNSANGFVNTFYFRMHFTITDDPASFTLMASNIIDDGAVYFLNGQEIPSSRYNLPAVPANIVYTTLALGAAAEGAVTTFTIPSSMINQGDNVLAVEVHQVNGTSSDIVFVNGLTATYPPPSPLTITSNPTNRVVLETATATFSVGVAGGQPRYQWYKWVNDVPVAIAGATRPTLTLTNVVLSDSGWYFATINNQLSSLSSASAFLTVAADLSGPTLVAADGTAYNTNVTVSFNKLVNPITATNIANYKITNLAGGTLTISRAVLDNGTNVILTSAARTSSAAYLLIVNNVQDRTPHNNVILPNSSIPISSVLSLLTFQQLGWAYYNPLPGFDPLDPGVGWNQVGFVPSGSWGLDGQSLFEYDPIHRDYPAPKGTDLSNGAIASYFRVSFNGISASPIGGKLLLHHVVDDGIIAYLNGVEVYRYNMPTGAVDYSTPASSVIDLATAVTAELPITSVHSGTNLLAVELHQTTEADPDLILGAEIEAQIMSYSTGAVMITQGPQDVTAVEGQPFQFSVMGVGAAQLQWKTNGTAIPGATNPVLSFAAAPTSWNGKLFSVTISNATSTATSTNARLTVVSDTTPPTLEAALASSFTNISVRFSEALSAATATTLANYRVTNFAGVNLPVVGAVSANGGTNVLLTVNTMSSPPYTLIVNNVRDNSSGANRILSNSTATVGFDSSVPINAAWFFNETGSDLGTAWTALAYNDTSAGWSNGLALLSNETAPVPAAINTPLLINGTVSGAYNYTFYFRHHLFAPFAANIPVVFRHIIDDGAIFYFNGTPFHTNNMPAGPYNYQTQATVAVGDGTWAGPFTNTVSVLAGDNVIAVEVHQSGTASSDITFGAELNIGVPSISTGGSSAPQLLISRQGTNAVVTWSGTGFVLEKQNTLSQAAYWVPVTNQAPLTVAPRNTTNQASFYRLHK